ncbi:site-specific DNA-methyltransferase [Lactiplantibacillus pentosus]|uniref:site-specific DNA-methyltransferase n=1 Tax=Lactiplantibacillus pentosus TaxID=1589 RepID=UPI001C1F2BE3|nr:site-specific DNA-methyltransferase [Lactiplantibacillus pentosus]MBU7462675.1 site-specific DNA-methyltransferase [Lactiplantibacillus pentosus]
MIDSKIMETTKSILKEFGNTYFSDKGTLKRNKVIEDLDAYTPMLMKALLANQLIHDTYTESVVIDDKSVEIFKLNQFIEMFTYKEYWQDSYTKFENKIGLTAGGKFIDETADIVLDFPFKDTVLKAGMTKEDQKDTDEPFLHETIAKAEIDQLLEPKIFVNATKYDQENLDGVSTDKFDDENLIIKGNNLIALHSLKQQYAGKVKLIYLDVPYNTGNDSFGYNDKFNHSAWLTFLKNRLEISYELLSDSGSIFVQLDDHEVKYLGVLLDEIFGRDNFVELITIVNNPRGRDYGGIANMHEFLFVYKKSPNTVLNPIVDSQKKFPYKDKFGPYEIRELRNRNTAFNSDNRPNLFYPIFADPNSADENNFYEVSEIESEQFSIEILPKKSSGIQTVWRWGKAKLSDDKGKNVVARPMKDGGWSIQEKYRKNTVMARSVWWDKEVNSERGTIHLKELLGGKFFAFPKPEGTLKRIIEIATNKDDLVLDFFMGSSTTQAVAMKMNRRFIGIEQMDYIKTVSVERLKKVIAGEQGGISKDVNWQGGGSFVYAELMEKNQGYLKDVQHAETTKQLENVVNRMIAGGADFDFRVDVEKVMQDPEYQAMSLADKKQLMVKVIDKNQLYYAYSDMEDRDVQELMSESDIAFNKSFYGERDL